ncbi:hypothetical protein CERSUDRAFT_67654 [Gelatoporia subvermispora B]|uniref:Lytic polysaccharide monooxygenase n=1 Tax=Ceriporiopsis subvermispora (strain B) TaxID=914234 RepID=M2R6U9_CERS8|nr:hypothetical protein CERSUDRAFT_67654 [Gelatoporia subvermispora B]
MLASLLVYAAFASVAPLVRGHAALWHNSMFGFNVTQQTFSYDNRPVVPLMSMPFSQWWMHNYLDYPPHPEDVFELPAGQSINTEISCDKGATSWYNTSEGGLAGYPTDNVCPGQPLSEFHTTGLDDVKGCGLGIAYKSDANQVQPDDFVIFSVNYTCVWTLNTEFQIPAEMPACPDGKCICSWFWIHSPDSGAEQIYMIPFQCQVTGATGTTPIGTPMTARRCGADPDNGRPDPTPGNCTIGPKNPLYWYQQEGNNMFEGTYSPPFYNALYGWDDGAQNDIFQDAYISSLGPAAPASTPSSSPAAKVVSSSAVVTPSAVPSSAAPAPSSVVASASASSAAAPPPPPSPSPSSDPPPAPASVDVTPSAAPAPAPVSAAAPSASSSGAPKCRARNGTSSKKRSAKRRHARNMREHTLH